MVKWENVERLHVEISQSCNAACPQCSRHPTSSYFLSPNINDNLFWTLDQTKQYLPKEHLTNIKVIFFNGTIGDFIVNPQALDIVRYFAECNPEIFFIINTNGSARNEAWWKELASIPNLKVNFALDGLSDTHHIYRRRTNFDTIINNAKTFINAGGRAEWHMVVFDHNKHQVDECKKISRDLGFHSFHYRYTDRRDVPVFDKNGNYEYSIRAVNKDGTLKTPNLITNQKIQEQSIAIKWIEKSMSKGIYRSRPIVQENQITSLTNLNDCESLERKEIYITAGWSVMPCCFLGSVIDDIKGFDHRTENFKRRANENNVNLDLYSCQNSGSVKDIVNNLGFDWIYNNLLSNPLLACYHSCHKTDSRYKEMWNGNTLVPFKWRSNI